jgi:adenylyltransferase/sulfurtransferase
VVLVQQASNILMKFTKNQFERYSRQIILKKVGIAGQKKLLKSKVLIIGAGGLGSPISIYLAATGVGTIGIVDKDKVEISNIQRQILFNTKDVQKSKSSIAAKKLKQLNPNINIIYFNDRIKKNNINKIAKNFDIIADGSDNFKTRFIINDYCLKNKKILVVGAISKFDGHVYTFNFLNKKSPCLRCFMPKIPKNDTLNCEYEGVLGPLAGVIGSIQANEIIKEILNIGESLCGSILIVNSLNLNFRKVKLKKNINCYCNGLH